MNNLNDKLNKQKQILESEGLTVAYICVYGSQNYGLDINNDEYQSDVDMKAIIVPTLDELVHNSKPISKVVDTEWGQCDVKDIRSYFQTLLKANPAYIETLYTEYYIIDDKFKDEFDQILDKVDCLMDVLKAQFIRAMYGMMCEKEKAMCHPYPTIAHKIEEFGYDGKQVHHIYRLLLMMKDYYVDDVELMETFYPNQQDIKLLIDLKLNKYPLEQAKEYVAKWMNEAKEIKEDVLSNIDEGKIDYSIKDVFTKLSQEIIKKKIKQECIKEAIEKCLN